MQSQNTEFQYIDKFARSLPSAVKNTKELAGYINRLDTNDICKLRALFVWITSHIQYDVKSFESGEKPSPLPAYTLQQRLAVCDGFTLLFDSVCNQLGIQSFIIPGYVKEGFNKRSSNHVWNAVMIDKKCYFIDVTWGSGYVEKIENQNVVEKIFKKISIKDHLVFIQQMNDQYFLAEPEFMMFTHLPADPMWQLLSYPASLDCFISNMDCDTSLLFFDYQDSLDRFLRFDEELQLIKSGIRSNQFNHLNFYDLSSVYINIGLKHYSIVQSIVPTSSNYLKNELIKTIEHLQNGLKYLEKAKQIDDSIYRTDISVYKAKNKASLKNFKEFEKIIDKSIGSNNKGLIKISDQKKTINQQIARYNNIAYKVITDEKIYLVDRPDELPDYYDSIVIFTDKFKVDSIAQLLLKEYDTLNNLLNNGFNAYFDSIEYIRNIIPEVLLITDSLLYFFQNYYIENDEKTFEYTDTLFAYAKYYYDLLFKYHGMLDRINNIGFKELHSHIKYLFKSIEVKVKESKNYLVDIKKLCFLDQYEEDMNEALNDSLLNAYLAYIGRMEDQKRFYKEEKLIVKFETKILKQHVKKFGATNRYLEVYYKYNLERKKSIYSNDKSRMKEIAKSVKTVNNICLKTLGK